jgi:putative addiction module component (TIGR02574 family)
MDAIKVSDLLHFSLDERLQLVEDLWDSIAAEAETSPEVLPLTSAQLQEVRLRSAAHRSDPSEAIRLEEALERIEWWSFSESFRNRVGSSRSGRRRGFERFSMVPIESCMKWSKIGSRFSL